MDRSSNLIQKIPVVAAMIFQDHQESGTFLIAKRKEPPLWEFPGGKVEDGETLQKALVREIKEELDCDIVVGEWIGQSTVLVGHKSIVMDLFQCTLIDGEPKPLEHLELCWIGVDALNHFEWAAADIPLLPKIREFMLNKAIFMERHYD